jgi:hypothetical protein
VVLAQASRVIANVSLARWSWAQSKVRITQRNHSRRQVDDAIVASSVAMLLAWHRLPWQS